MTVSAAAAVLCAALPWPGGHPTPLAGLDCHMAVHEAAERGLPLPLVVSLLWTESKFDRFAVSSAGAVGTTQVIPRIHCPNGKAEGCDWLSVGLDYLAAHMRRHGGRPERPKSWRTPTCHYNSGNKCKPRSWRWAEGVVARTRPLVRALRGADGIQ